MPRAVKEHVQTPAASPRSRAVPKIWVNGRIWKSTLVVWPLKFHSRACEVKRGCTAYSSTISGPPLGYGVNNKMIHFFESLTSLQVPTCWNIARHTARRPFINRVTSQEHYTPARMTFSTCNLHVTPNRIFTPSALQKSTNCEDSRHISAPGMPLRSQQAINKRNSSPASNSRPVKILK